MDRIDIVKGGSKILNKIFDDFGVTEIKELKLLYKFLERLLLDTKGLVIFDFMDSGNWDCFGSYSIDYENGFVFFNWHYYVDQNGVDAFVAKEKYKPSITSLMLHFKDLQIERLNNFPFITLRGYAINEKDTLKYFQKIDANAKLYKELKANFYSLFVLDRGNYIEDCYCHNTPIYSILIIPKDTADNTAVSMKLLFLYNYSDCLKRLNKIEKSLKSGIDNEDELCEKANTIRRIFEFVLKVECCYHRQLNFDYIFSEDDYRVDDFNFKSSYSDMLLGDLLKIIKVVKSEAEIIILNKILRLSNELSHDSGKQVTKSNLDELLSTVIKYTTMIAKIITF